MHILVFRFLLLMALTHLACAQEIKPQVLKTEEAVFAMGCFWCAEAEFRGHENSELLPGIVSVRVGYAGGVLPKPTYESHEGYKEAVKVIFNPTEINYDTLLQIFWHNIDPFDDKGQFCDKGYAYTSVLYYSNSGQKKKAFDSKDAVEKQLRKEVVTEVVQSTSFVDAEEYHQNYKFKNPIRYRFYRSRCGRDSRLESVWMK